ncbi:MAG: lipocalin-like domain-containing protein [Xanthobacteraceae bacterium]
MRLLLLAGRVTLAFLVLTMNLSAIAQEANPLKDQLVGTWRFVSSSSQRDDGSNTWGANAKGQLIFTRDGRFSLQLMRSDRPMYKSNTRMRGSIIENQATTRGTLSYFGTYTVNEPDHTLTYNIESSSFPNFNDTSQKRVMTLSGDELRYLIPAPSRGTTPTTMVWRRQS